MPPHLLVRFVAEGQNVPTEGHTTDVGKMAIRQRLIDAGLATTIFPLLERCEDETFAEVLGRAGEGVLVGPAS